MGTGSEQISAGIAGKTVAARCLSPFSTVTRHSPSENGDRHRRQTRNSRKSQSATEPVPIFGLPAYSLSSILTRRVRFCKRAARADCSKKTHLVTKTLRMLGAKQVPASGIFPGGDPAWSGWSGRYHGRQTWFPRVEPRPMGMCSRCRRRYSHCLCCRSPRRCRPRYRSRNHCPSCWLPHCCSIGPCR